MTRKEVKQAKGTCNTPGCENQISVGSRSGLCRSCYKARQQSSKGTRRGRGHLKSEDLRKALSAYKDPKLAPGAINGSPFEAIDGAQKIEKNYFKSIPHIKGDVIWVSDVHVPLHDTTLCKRILGAGAHYKIKTLIILGDLFDNDALSTFNKASQNPMSPAEQIYRALQLLAGWACHYENIYLVMGNHDERLIRVIEKARDKSSKDQKLIDNLTDILIGDDIAAMSYRGMYVTYMERFVDKYAPVLKDRLHFLELPMCWLDGPEGENKILAVHQEGYSKNAPMEAKRLWEQFGCSIITSHTHGAGMMFAPHGNSAFWNAGCATDMKFHRYLHEKVKGGFIWKRGFGVIKNGVVSLLVDNPYTTDWTHIDKTAEKLNDKIKNKFAPTEN